MSENASDNMDLTQSTWMVRDLEQAVSDVLLLEDDSVIAGGWDGAIKYWSAEGDTVWSIETPNRISCLTIQSEKLYATSGLHLLKIDLKTGHIDWQIGLEGSADAVVVTKKCVIASSSVYDIEHNDFLESAIWSVSFEGEGDALFQSDNNLLWMGHGFRTDPRSRDLIKALFPKCISLQLIDPRFYHLDTCFCLLPGGQVMYFPNAFSKDSLQSIADHFATQDRIEINEEDALHFACNAIVIGNTLILNHAGSALIKRLQSLGYRAILQPVDEFLKAGGGTKCLALSLSSN